MYFIHKLAKAMRSRVPWLYIVLGFIPIAGIIALLHLVSAASQILDRHYAVLAAPKELVEIAHRQKQVLWIILINIPATFIPGATIVTGLIGICFIYKLAKALRSSAAWAYIILAFIPLVGFLALFLLNGRASRMLRSSEVEVGLMGAKSSDLDVSED